MTKLKNPLTKTPGVNEIYDAICSQKNNKAMGHDNMPAEVFKRHKLYCLKSYTDIRKIMI